MENMNNELTHHGVKGMKWGVRRAAKLRGSAVKSKGNARVLDAKAKSATSLGKNRAAESYRKKAASERRKASDYEKEAKKLETDSTYTELRYRMHKEEGRRRIGRILGAIGGLATAGVAAATIKVGSEFVGAVRETRKGIWDTITTYHGF